MPTAQPMQEAEGRRLTHYRIFNEVLNGRNLELLPQLCTQDYVYHGPGGLELEGIDQFRGMIEGYFTAFPDMHMEVEQRVVEGNLISTRWRVTGTHDGPLGDIEATGEKIDIGGQVIMRFEGTKIAEEWEFFDELAMLKQVGAITE